MKGYKHDYEYEWDVKYCYPESFVLKNKFDIRDKEKLSEAERRSTALNILEIMDKPVRGKFDFNHLKNIHRAIFQDVYAWAGTPRTVDISKGNPFCLSLHLESYAESIFEKLKAENLLIGKTPEEMPGRLAYYLSEINVLHPFREGNGRTQRVFIGYLAQYAGLSVDFSQVGGHEMIEASVQSFFSRYGMMTEMFERILSPISPQERQAFHEKVF
ncbi:MAG: Fic family protein [Clostridiales Family XIII bacterium]|jgi:cell filamentation protein|nr:Fic family protein [Clostridiales Family XIII bacterium]